MPAIIRIASLMPVKVQPPIGEMRIYIGGILHKIPVLSINVHDNLSQKIADSLNQSPVAAGGVTAEVHDEMVNLFARTPNTFSWL
jgi:hypothetical protein